MSTQSPKLLIDAVLTASIVIALILPMRAAAYDGDILSEYAHGTPIPEAQFSPVAPDVQAMIRYGGGSQVDRYTGAASYAINLYSYSDKDFTIPVTISYHGDGFKPGRNPGCVGTGWSLGVGGVITQEVRGMPDEATAYTYASKNKGDGSIDDVFTLAGASGIGHSILKQMLCDYNRMASVNVFGFGARTVSSRQMEPVDFAYSGEIGREYILFQKEVTSSSPRNFEMESDLYHFSFMGINGTFIIGEDGKGIVLNSDYPAGEIRIEYQYNQYSPLWTTFSITTGDGYTYTFGSIDTCTSSSSWGAQGESPESEASISCWKLTKIQSRSGLTAEFSYSRNESVETTAYAVCLDDLTLTDVGGNRQETWMGNGLYRTGTVTNRIDQNLLTNISVPGRVNISFTYDNTSRLVSMTVNNMFHRVVRTCFLTYKPCGFQSLLKSVWLSGEGEYSLTYYDEEEDVPQSPTWKEDWYGYYSKDVRIPEYRSGSLVSYANSLMESRGKFDFESARSLMLKRISYPTGGYSDYYYEPNSYGGKSQSPGSVQETQTGGVRVSRIDTYTSSEALSDSRRFLYKDTSGKCSGILYEKPHIYLRYKLEAPALTIEREVVSSITNQSSAGHIGYSRVLEEVADEIGGVAKSVTEYRYLLRADGPFEETYLSSTSEIITQDGWSFIFEDLGSDFPESRTRNGSLCEGRESRKTVYSGTIETGTKMYDTEHRIGYWSPRNVDNKVVVPAIIQGRTFDRTMYLRSSYVYSQSTTRFSSDHSPMKTRVVLVSATSDTGRPDTFSTTDSRDRDVITKVEFRNDFPALVKRKSVSVGGRSVLDERYDYSYFTVNGKSVLFPSEIKRGLIAADGKVSNYETVLKVSAYDNYGNPTEVIDALGNTATYCWGYSGLHPTMKTMTVSGNRLTWLWTWEPLVGMTSETLPDTTETIYGLDEFGRLTAVVESGGITEKYEYNIVNQ